ncbi:TNT domain-containing protein [Amycolatopsis sp.]|uniref:TNT domain-containing protein n=1 Tax=Amycolatopsis sp. TaxID=37632 RepID=UPI00260536AC|nr:TNT domain-containing protein [Amycolatopsis sp.]
MIRSLTPQEQRSLLVRIGKLARAVAPDGWQRIEVDFRQVGQYTEIDARTETRSLEVPELTELLTALRAGMHEPEKGTWLQARFTLVATGTFDFDFALDAEPRWHDQPDNAVYLDELAVFPREPEYLEDWWRRRVGLPLGLRLRHARVVDAVTEGEPVVDRPELPADVVPLVLQYLEREPAILVADGPEQDIFTPDAEPDVPASYHTDGTWTWPASVPHYLREHGVAPEPDLVAHIAGQQFQPPYVDLLVRRTAEADLLGQPRPQPIPGDVEPTAGDIAAELETRPDPRLDVDDVLAVLVQRLGEHGVWPEAYRVGERADSTWCLNETPEGWEVARYEHGVAVRPRLFDQAEDAAHQLLGALLLHPARMTAGHETPLETATELDDWPITESDGEPPLTLLRNKRVVQLVEGTTVVRFGPENGNLVHGPQVRFATTSLPLERDGHEQTYQLRRPLHVITGITVPWANLPGGAVAYVLPKPVVDHLADKSLERIS